MLSKQDVRHLEKEYHFELGKKLRQSRIICGLSQADIAPLLGITFQQVQKYEKGVNRISPYRLSLWAQHTKTPLMDYFHNDHNEALCNITSDRLVLSLVSQFGKLPIRIQNKVTNLLIAINGGSGE